MRGLQRNGFLLATAAVAAGIALREALRRKREIDFKGRTVLITGGSRGLGLVLAREFAREGAHIALCARDDAELAQAKEDLEGHGATVFTVRCDLANKSEINAMVRRVIGHYGRIDVLVNNAGVIEVGPMDTMTDEDFDEAMNVHFWAPLHATTAALPDMRSRNQGRIVNITSIGGKVSLPHMLPYSVSKFAEVGLSEGLRAELMKDGIYVTTVCPGLMRTGSQDHADFKGDYRKEYTGFSLLAASPISSMNAQEAARQIVVATKQGDAEVVLSSQAQLLATFHALFPGVTADILGAINYVLPGPGRNGKNRVKGRDSHTAMSRSSLTLSLQEPMRANNELP